jgi:central glycolytic genes regulator
MFRQWEAAMDQLFSLMERFAPEALELVVVRYQILRQVFYQQPVGRRQISKALGFPERTVRGEIETLRNRGALYTTAAGIFLTSYGKSLLQEIDQYIPFLYRTQTLAYEIKNMFRLNEVIVVPGDSYQNHLVKKDLGATAARYLQRILKPNSILAVTGGTTLAEMAAAMDEGPVVENILVVPARGGLGEDMEQQAGAIAARIAQNLGGQYRLLHIPDNLEEGTAEILRNDSHVTEIIHTIRSSHILIHGIGSALEMASRRKFTASEMKQLHDRGAVGEALRYYFDKEGKIVFEVAGFGLEKTDLAQIPEIVAVAGGSHKGEAIRAVLKGCRTTVLITDEGAALEILNNNKQ